MLLLHGTGLGAAALFMRALRYGEPLREHDVVWHDSGKDRIYFWGDSGSVDGKEVSIKQDMVIRAGESAMYTKAISGSLDELVCVLVFDADSRAHQYLCPDPDADGGLPAFYMTIADLNRCLEDGSIRLLTAVLDDIYQPELRWDYLATMRAMGRKFPAEGVAGDERFLTAMRHILFRGGALESFERLFERPLLSAKWRLMVR